MPDAKENFRKLFHEVFDAEGNVTNCGREKCKALISAAKNVTTVYGNEETGIMCVEAIKLLYRELYPNGDEDQGN